MPCVRGEIDMRGRRCGIWGLIIALGLLMLGGEGCSWCKTRQGWYLQSGWSLEFKRMPFYCGRATECTEGCSSQVLKEPNCGSAAGAEGEVLHNANPKLLDKFSNSPFAKLMGRQGRLGLCASCGHLARFKESGAKEQAPPAPVIAKFVPVPTEPVFCPREEKMQPVSFDPAPNPKPKKLESSVQSKKSQLKAPLPDEIPLPPVVSETDKSAAASPRQLNVPSEPSSWIFSPTSEVKPDQLSEAQLPPRPSERATRR
jgi:hypothetical protein